jgi:hypothetical protein
MPKKGITGHDEWVLTEALATALVALQQLPAKHQPQAHMEDIRKLLAAGCQPGTVTLHLAQANGDELKYLGKVGSGFDEDSLKAVSSELEKLTTIKRPIKEKPLDDARSIWVESKLMCEVQFASFTPDGLLREAVFVRLRPDLTL